MTVCSNSTIPTGYVIKSAGNSTSCANWSATAMNTYSIKIPASTEIVCSNSPIPAGYVVIATGYSSSQVGPFRLEVRFNGKACSPQCDGKQCGDDGCGGSCGASSCCSSP